MNPMAVGLFLVYRLLTVLVATEPVATEPVVTEPVSTEPVQHDLIPQAEVHQDRPKDDSLSKPLQKPKKRVVPKWYDEPLRKGISWDIQLEVGYGFHTWRKVDQLFYGNLRAGVLLVREPIYAAAGAIFTLGGITSMGGGAQVELTHLWSGFWGQVGLECGERSRWVFSLATGWSVIGLEWQQGLNVENATGLFIKMRIPIGIAVFGFTH
jgi:hypothetical protein